MLLHVSCWGLQWRLTVGDGAPCSFLPEVLLPQKWPVRQHSGFFPQRRLLTKNISLQATPVHA